MIFVDFETRSKCDLKRAGAWVYSQHPSTEVLCMAYAIDDGDVHLWLPGDEIRHDMHREMEAHNAFFEKAIWTNTLKWPTDKITWSCSAAKCAAHSLPRALDAAGAALGLSVQKDQEGKRIMMKLCKPRKPTKNNPAVWHEDPEDYEKLYAYCMDDVRAERALSKALRDLNKIETKVWQLDQTINERGIRVDIEAVEAALALSDSYASNLNEEMAVLTEGQVQKASEAGKLLKWVQESGGSMNSVTKAEVAETLEMDIPDNVRRALEIRQLVSKTSVAKYKAIKSATAKDGRIRDLLMYCGAGPGRWAGKLVQPHNLPRNNFRKPKEPLDEFVERLEQYFSILKLGATGAFTLCFPEVMDTISQLIRPCLISSEGESFFGGDYSSIEARVLLWLADDERALNVFRRGLNLYKKLSGEIYGLSETEAQSMPKSDPRYMVGKQGILGLGFGMAAQKFMDTCHSYGITIDSEMAQKVVDTYRTTFIKVKNLWYAQERAAIGSVRTGDFKSCGKIGWGIHGDFLFCKLPSKRLIAYYKPELHMMDTPWGEPKETLTYMAMNSVTRKWERTKTYGGKIVENVTQGVARDLMAEAMLRCEDGGYEVVLTVHDEIITEKEEGTVEEFEKLMSHVPEWGVGIPIEVEGWSGKRYLK